jgi:hypothetical protein
MEMRLSLLAAGLILLAFSCAFGQQASSPTPTGGAGQKTEPNRQTAQDPLNITVHLPKMEDGDIIRVLHNVIAKTSAVSYEVLRNTGDEEPYRVKGFKLDEGDYVIGDLLAKIKLAADTVTWQADADHIGVCVRLCDEFPDPLDKEVRMGMKGSFTREKIIDWLNEQVPEVRQMVVREVKITGVPDTTKEVAFERGMTVRAILTSMGKAWGVGWAARVNSKPRVFEGKNKVTGEKVTIADVRITVAFGKGFNIER